MINTVILFCFQCEDSIRKSHGKSDSGVEETEAHLLNITGILMHARTHTHTRTHARTQALTHTHTHSHKGEKRNRNVNGKEYDILCEMKSYI